MTLEIDALAGDGYTRNGIDPCNTCADWMALKAENEALRRELERLCHAQPRAYAVEDAAYFCLTELAGVDTSDRDLRDHPEAWAAMQGFAEKVRIETLGSARDASLDRMAENARALGLDY